MRSSYTFFFFSNNSSALTQILSRKALLPLVVFLFAKAFPAKIVRGSGVMLFFFFVISRPNYSHIKPFMQLLPFRATFPKLEK